MDRFTVSRNIYHGDHAFDSLVKLKGKSALIVTGENSVRDNGILDNVLSHFKDSGIKVNVINGIPSNPTKELVSRGAFHFGNYSPDWIIALGGGSVIDAAKVMWIFYEHPNIKFDDLISNKNLPRLRSKSRFVAIPTTFSVSSVTPVAMISDWDTRFKWIVSDFQLIPDMIIMDNSIVDNINDNVLVYSIMDSLAHAFESFMAVNSNSLSDSLSLGAIDTIFRNVEDGFNGDREAKIKLQYASLSAGMSSGNAGLGICHSLCDVSELLFKDANIPHGLLSAIYLPYTIKYNSITNREDYVSIARRCGIMGFDADELFDNLFDFVLDLNRVFNIPSSLKELDVNFSDITDNREELIDKVLLDENTKNNPRTVKDEDVMLLFENIYKGSYDF